MATVNNYESKPGARHSVIRDHERKERELSKYLNTCQLYKRVNPECHPHRSELIEDMYEEKKVMKNRTCRRKGAQEFNFKKQSACRIISNNKLHHKGAKFDCEDKIVNKREIENYNLEESDEE